MKILKALLPMLLVILVRLLVHPTFIDHHHFEEYLLTQMLLTQMPIFSVILFGFLYFRKHRMLRISLIILSVFVLLNITVRYGPIFLSFLDIPIHLTVWRTNFSLFFFVILTLITIYIAIRSKHIVAIVFAGITLLLVIYTEFIYGPGLLAEPFRTYNPYEEFRVLLKAGFYRSMLKSASTILILSLPIFTSFYALLTAQKK